MREGRVMETNIRKGELALDGGMEFWEISGDLGRPLQVLSSPSVQTTTRWGPLLKLTSSYFYNLHTCANGLWTCEWSETYTQTHTHAEFLHMNVESVHPQFILQKHSVAIIISDAWLFLLFESLWDGTSLARYFACIVFSEFLSNWITDQICLPACLTLIIFYSALLCSSSSCRKSAFSNSFSSETYSSVKRHSKVYN